MEGNINYSPISIPPTTVPIPSLCRWQWNMGRDKCCFWPEPQDCGHDCFELFLGLDVDMEADEDNTPRDERNVNPPAK